MTMHEPTLEERLSNGRLPSIEDGERVIWDDRVTGLGLRLRARSAPVWIGHKRALGGLDGMGIEEARDLARSLFDPGERLLWVAPTLASFVLTFIENNVGRWKPNTVKSHRRGLMRHTVPVLGSKSVNAITWSGGKADRQGIPGSRPVACRPHAARSALGGQELGFPTAGVRLAQARHSRPRRDHASSRGAR